MPLNPAGYPEDLTGLSPTNLITNELHIVNSLPDTLFVPAGGPYFTDSIVLRHSVTNQILQPITHYKLMHLHKEASLKSGSPIAVAVALNPAANIPGVLVDYQVIGGELSETASVIRNLLENYNIPPYETIAWGQIIGAPVQFPPVMHLHNIRDTYGWLTLVSVLEELRKAILVGDGFAFNAIYLYIANFIQSQDFITRDEYESNQITPFFEIKTFPDYAAMRACTTMINDAPAVYACLGKDNMFDGKGRLFLWDIHVNTGDNNDTIVKPNHIPNPNYGRFKTFQRVETDLIALATSVQRKINVDGTVDDSMYENNAFVSGDVFNYVKSGYYWVGDANTIANAPFSWCVMRVDNITVDANGSSSIGEVVHTYYNGNGDKATRIRYYDPGSTSFLWTGLTYYARREGDANFNFNVKDAVGPDHAVTLRQLINNETDCHLGIVIKYFGETSILMPCYVGESVFHGNLVRVYISNNLRVINLNDITPIYPLDANDAITYPATYEFGYIYLVRNPNNGTYRLIATTVPPETYLLGNMSKERKRLRLSTATYWSDLGYSIQPEDTCFLGMASKQGLYPKWWLCRSWFQDAGMIEHHGLYNSPRDDITSLPKISGPLARLDFDDTNTIEYNFDNPHSPYYNRVISTIQMICWAGEKVDFSLKGNIAINHPGNDPRGANIHLNLNRYKGVFVGTTTLAVNECLLLGNERANAQSAGYKQHFEISDSKVVPLDGIYETYITGGTSNVDTTGYLAGAHASGVSRTVLSMAVNEYHAFREFVVATIAIPTEQLSITLYQDYNEVRLYDFFINIYGAFNTHPFLTRVTLDITNGAQIGSTTTTQPGLWISNGIPAGVEVVINLGGGCYLVGKGGKGGDNSGTSPYNRSGEDGGDAIGSERPFIINVSGVLAGGGGGGRAGWTGTSGATGSDGGPGGGGAGKQVGAAGNRYRTTPTSSDGDVAANAANPGTLTTGGLGGTSIFSGSVNENFSQGQNGGPGGNLGQPGGVGFGGIAVVDQGGSAGAAGYAIRKLNGSTATVNIIGGVVYGNY